MPIQNRTKKYDTEYFLPLNYMGRNNNQKQKVLGALEFRVLHSKMKDSLANRKKLT